MNKFIFVFLFLVLFSSCKEETLNTLFDKAIPLKCNVILENENIVCLPKEIFKYNNFLYLGVLKCEHGITILDLNEKEFSFSTIVKGNGPGEYASGFPNLIFQKGQLYMNDPAKRQLNNYDISIHPIINDQQFESFDYSWVNKLLISCQPLNDDWYISTGIFEQHPFLLINKNRNDTISFGEFPDAGKEKKNMNGITKNQVFQSFINCNRKNRFIEASLSGTYYRIYELNGNQPQLIKSTIYNLPEYREDGAIHHTSLRGFMNVCSTEKYIYLLYAGRLFSEGYSGTNKLLILDWNGNIIKTYKLDKKLTCITTDNDSEIYGVCAEGEGVKIVKITLPKQL